MLIFVVKTNMRGEIRRAEVQLFDPGDRNKLKNKIMKDVDE